MDAFYGLESRRALFPEIKAHIEKRTGSTPVAGFSSMLDPGNSAVGSERISNFMEMHDYREWLLSLSARKGITWKTDPIPTSTVSRVAFILSVGFGNGSPLPQPSGQWDLFVNDRLAISIRTVNHSQLWRMGDCTFAFSANRIESAEPYGSLCLSSLIQNESSAAFGPAFLTVPINWIQAGEPALLRIEPRCGVASRRWFQLAPTGSMLQTADIYRLVDMLNGELHQVEDYKVFFGDIHTHSGQVMDECENKGCGMGSREENYEYARGPGGLDFYALTDHECQIDPLRTQEYLSLADAYNEDGRFVCLPAFEYTNPLYGHRNVYFREGGGTVFNSSSEWNHLTLDPDNYNTPNDLWAALEKNAVPFMTIPHHPSATSHPLNLNFYNPEYDRLYEIYSCWGSSEYYGDFPRGVSDRWRSGDFRDALSKGQRFGVMASSDGHDGHPGNAQSSMVKHHHLFHFCGSGRTAVLCRELTRPAVFEALQARRCYATTGVPIVLDVRMGTTLMGSEIPRLASGKRPQLRVRCTGTNGLDHIRIIKNGQVAATLPYHGEVNCNLEWEDATYTPDKPSAYYVRVVQKDRESAWSSPIWIG